MTSAYSSKSSNTDGSKSAQLPANDWRLFLRLWPYIHRQRRYLVLPLVLLAPLSLANALQPFLIGQAISLIRQEPVSWFLEGRSLQGGLNLLDRRERRKLHVQRECELSVVRIVAKAV